MSMFEELKRRKVFRVVMAYIVVAWVVVQVASITFPVFEAPAWALRVFIFVCLLGFPVALVLAWSLEVTPEGVRVDQAGTGSKRFFTAVSLLTLLAIGWFEFGQPSYRSDDVVETGAPSVAVLPFQNMSGDPAQEYFSDGMTEELLNVLARNPGLKVAARTSVFQFKNKAEDVREIGKELGVSYLIEGSIRRENDDIRVTAQLIRVADGFHVWSEDYNRKLDSVFALQDDIARQIAEQLAVSIEGKKVEDKRPDISTEAYDEYLKGRDLYRRRSNLSDAIGHFDRVVRLAPDYADGWASLSLSYELVNWTRDAELKLAFVDRLDRMRDTAEQARRLAPTAPMTLHALGNVARSEGRFEDALELYDRSMKADPSYGFVQEDYSELLLGVGHDRESLETAQALVKLDPYARVFWGRIIEYARIAGDRALLEETANVAKNLSTGYQSNDDKLLFDLMNGDNDRAWQFLAELEREMPVTGALDRRMMEWALRGDKQYEAEILRLLQSSLWYSDFLMLTGHEDLYVDVLETFSRRGGGYAILNFLRQKRTQHLLATPRVKQMLADNGFVKYWQDTGWPAFCRPLDRSDKDGFAFSCDHGAP